MQLESQLESILPISEYGIGEARQFGDLLAEIESGETQIIWEQGRPIRLLRIVVLKVFAHPDYADAMLVEDRQVLEDGRVRYRGIQGLSEKLYPGESPDTGARRAIWEELQIPSGQPQIVFHCESFEEKVSPSYPGLLSRYQKFFYVALLPLHACREEYAEPRDEGGATYFRWRLLE